MPLATQIVEHHDSIVAIGGEHLEETVANQLFDACYANGIRLNFIQSMIQGFVNAFQVGLAPLLTLTFLLMAKMENPSQFFSVSTLIFSMYGRIFFFVGGLQQFIQSAGPVHRVGELFEVNLHWSMIDIIAKYCV